VNQACKEILIIDIKAYHGSFYHLLLHIR